MRLISNFLLCSRIFFAGTFPDITHTKDVVALIDLLFLWSCFLVVSSLITAGASSAASSARASSSSPLVKYMVPKMHKIRREMADFRYGIWWLQLKAAANAVRRWLHSLRGHSVPRVSGQHNVLHHFRQDLGHPIRQGKKNCPGRLAVVTRGMPARRVFRSL